MNTSENNIPSDKVVYKPTHVDGKELVWAKMKRFCPWPAYIVTNPSALLKRKKPHTAEPTKCIFFFGSKDFAWIEVSQIYPYEEFKNTYTSLSKKDEFNYACTKIQEFISDPIKHKEHAEAALRGRAKKLAEQRKQAGRDVNEEFNKLRANTSIVSADESSIQQTQDNDDSVSVKSLKSSTSKGSARQSGRSIGQKPKSPVVMKIKVNAKKARTVENNTDFKPANKRKRTETIDDVQNDVQNPTDSVNNLTNNEVNPTVALISPRQKSTVPNAASQILSRPVLAEEVREDIDLNVISDEITSRKIVPNPLRFGFLGLGNMGTLMVRNLINTGHKVVVWNRTFETCRKFEAIGAGVVSTPADVVDNVDITFSCVSVPSVVKEMVFGNCGVLSAVSLTNGKGYVEMTSIDDSTSQDIGEAITRKGGRYLEAQMQGSKTDIINGMLIILAAGDKTLYQECTSCFESISRVQFFMGDVGSATKMCMLLQVVSGVALAGLGEAMALAHRSGVCQKDFMELLEHTKIASPFLVEKGKAIAKGNFSNVTPIQYMEKDLKMGLALAESVDQPMHVTSAVKELYTHAKRNGYALQDMSSLYIQCIL